MAALRGTFHKRFPELSMSEINMKVLAYLTPVRNGIQMTAISFYVQIVNALDEINAPYMIVGAFGGYPFGITRVTFDIDILVDLRGQDFEALSKKFPLPRYYADPEMRKIQADGIIKL